MTLETMQAITEELVQRGIPATLEYPGFISVGDMNFGDQGDMFDGEVMKDGEVVVETLDSNIPRDTEDVQRCADFICAAVKERAS